jgi:uncharacterized Ntn-hydrolase superfamily protein
MASNQLANGTTNSMSSSTKGGVQIVYDKLFEYYNYGLDSTRSAVDKTVSVAAHTGALGLGLAIVSAQMGLIATTSATNVFLSSLIYTKNTGHAAIQGVQTAEKAAEQRIREAIELTIQAAKIPADKAVEHSHGFLDIANAVFDRLLGLPHVQEPVNSTIPERVSFLARRVSGGLVNQANNNVIDPVRTKVFEIAQQIQKQLMLVDYVKQKKEWANEKVENISTNVLELKQKIETEAKQYCIPPEEMLVRSIRKTSALLNENFETLRKQGNELAGEGTAHHIENATHFIEHLDKNFSKAENIYQIRDEVIIEAKQKVNEMAQWTASFIVSPESPDQTVGASKKEF